MDPPATISAPDPTEPSTVTSPSGKMIDWPERTGWSSSSELDFFVSRFGVGSVRVITQGRPPVSRGGMLGVSRSASTPSMPSTRMLRCSRLVTGEAVMSSFSLSVRPEEASPRRTDAERRL